MEYDQEIVALAWDQKETNVINMQNLDAGEIGHPSGGASPPHC